MDAPATYLVVRTTWFDGQYLREGSTVELPTEVGSLCRHLELLEDDEDEAEDVEAPAPVKRRRRQKS